MYLELKQYMWNSNNVCGTKTMYLELKQYM